MSNILRIDASARTSGSTTRQLTDQLVTRLVEQGYGAHFVRRPAGWAHDALLVVGSKSRRKLHHTTPPVIPALRRCAAWPG